ncbi:MAG: 4-hydroxy-tetrahydrodipicolinate reductase [Candidatus Micrarchaeota archaeon]
MLKIAVFGARGRMGRAVCSEVLINYKGKIELVSGVESESLASGVVEGSGAKVYSARELEKALASVDLSIHFASAEADCEAVCKALSLGKLCVVGTTGFSSEQMKRMKDALAKSRGSLFIAPNFSPLVNVQIMLAKKAAQVLAPLGYDFGVVEEHHVKKLDSPSGTAKKLADAVVEGRGSGKLTYRKEEKRAREKDEVDMAVLRLGGTAGEHEVRIVGEHGRLEINSLMYSRADFARGAIEAALWLAKNAKAGRLFGMSEMLKLE